MAHPRGVKPLGNQLCDSLLPQYTNTRSIGLGQLAEHFDPDDDHLICRILDHLPAVDLARLALCSRALYCWSYFDEIWKHYVVAEMNAHFQWHGRSWRETYAYNYTKQRTGQQTGHDFLIPTPAPIKIPWFYSDFLYQPWWMARMPMRSDWLRVDNIQRRVASQLTVDEFNREFGVPNQPVLLEGAALHWPAMQEWTQQNLIDRYGDQIFTAEAMDIRMRDYWRYCNQLDSDDDSPFYLFDKRCFTRPETSELATHFTVPPYFAEDLFALLPVDQRPDYRWLIIGPRWSGSSFHKDPNGTSAWNATISGSKKWVFYPPNSIPPGVMVSDDQSEVRTPSSLKEWFQYYYRQATTNRSGLPPPIECITRPGDVVFVPSGWWHCVVNLEPSVAVTQNFVCAANLKRVLHFLRHRAHQISGVGCDAADSLHDRVINSLISAKRPELAALDRADDKENCKRQKLSFWSDTVSRANNNSNDVEGNAGKSSITKQEFTFSFNLEI